MITSPHCCGRLVGPSGPGARGWQGRAAWLGGPVDNGSVSSADDASGNIVESDPVVFVTTPFDSSSVTNYVIAACGSTGNYDFTGYSDHDRLALRILYPESTRVAELNGIRVIKTGQPLVLGNLWKYQGASVDTSSTSVANSFSWRLNGVQRATTPHLNINVAEGKHSLAYNHKDFLGRSYSFKSEVEVLSPAQFARRMASQAVIIGAATY